MPLNFRSLQVLVPTIIKSKHDSYEKRRQALLASKHKDDAAIENHIADVLADAVPALGDQKGSFLRKTIEQMERNYGNAARFRQATSEKQLVSQGGL